MTCRNFYSNVIKSIQFNRYDRYNKTFYKEIELKMLVPLVEEL